MSVCCVIWGILGFWKDFILGEEGSLCWFEKENGKGGVRLYCGNFLRWWIVVYNLINMLGWVYMIGSINIIYFWLCFWSLFVFIW